MGFNPCFVGSAFWTTSSCIHSPYLLMFQSLFCWICLLDERYNRNPISGGHVSILVLLDLPFGPIFPYSSNPTSVFQSLFCWICLLDNRSGHTKGKKEMVSILVLLDLPFGQPNHPNYQTNYQVSILVLLDLPFGLTPFPGISDAEISFNPCFVGSAFWTLLLSMLKPWGCRRLVSILVLLDLPFGPK